MPKPPKNISSMRKSRHTQDIWLLVKDRAKRIDDAVAQPMLQKIIDRVAYDWLVDEKGRARDRKP